MSIVYFCLMHAYGHRTSCLFCTLCVLREDEKEIKTIAVIASLTLTLPSVRIVYNFRLVFTHPFRWRFARAPIRTEGRTLASNCDRWSIRCVCVVGELLYFSSFNLNPALTLRFILICTMSCSVRMFWVLTHFIASWQLHSKHRKTFTTYYYLKFKPSMPMKAFQPFH